MIPSCTKSFQKSSSIKVKGKYDFYIEVIENGDPPNQNSSIILNGYTNYDRKILVPIKCKWYR